MEKIRIFDDSLDSNDTLWRYTTFPKLLNLFMDSDVDQSWMRLISFRADKFEDSYEGTLSTRAERKLGREILNNWESWWEMAGRPNQWYTDAVQGRDYHDFVHKSAIQDQQHLHEKVQKMRENTYLHCWRKANYEDSAMWGAYTSKSDGVVIKTTTDELRESICECVGIPHLGSVDYIDFSSGDMKLSHISPYFYKQTQFESESEFRIVLSDITQDTFKNTDASEMPTSSANKRDIYVDGNELIDEVRVHPKCSDYFRDVVDHSLMELGVDVSVKHSSLRPSLHGGRSD